jgi:hypothetical protein
MSKEYPGTAVISALLCVLAAPAAWAEAEREPNEPIASAQALTIGTDGRAAVDGVVGGLSGPPVVDVDFFTFEGREGDVVTLDIDGGMGGVRSVDTMLGVFGPHPVYTLLRANDDAGMPLDAGSTHPLDSRIDNFRLPATGRYVVGVSSYPRAFRNGGTTATNALNAQSNGDYTLIVSGVTVPVMQINIDIKPGHGDDLPPINPKSRGKVPVALLGSRDFAVADVDVGRLTFGHSGDEISISKCGERVDVNGDGVVDLVCHFENQLARFLPTDEEGILKGRLLDGGRFEGRGWLKVVPEKAAH